MYFAKARKQLEEQDMREVQERLEKYQRTDTARVVQQAKSSRTEDSGPIRDDFRPDELPDGAFVSPKHTPSHSSQGYKPDHLTVSRSAEYIGSFSVTGTDESCRARVVETQLEALRSVTKSKKVILVISLQGISVSSSDLQNVYMFHELKRISYATCDPDYCQFSFLAREPKAQADLHYCHAFITQTPEQAEELNTIIGNAFKMAYAQQREHQLTFHELIEAQVVEQQAKFREIEKQAQVELQRKLADIARPTPFSQQAIQRMEQRKHVLDETSFQADILMGKNRLWAKQALDKVQHRFSLNDNTLPVSVSSTNVQPEPTPVPVQQDELPLDKAYVANKAASKFLAHRNITKHNSAPLFPASMSSPSDEPVLQGENVSCVIPHHPLSAQAIRVSIESKKDTKFKGSPVIALKNEIDRRFLSNGSETVPLETATAAASSSSSFDATEKETDQKAVRHEQVRHQIHMAKRPLPSIPSHFSPPPASVGSNNNAGSSQVTARQRPTSSYHYRSFDDNNVIPSSSSSPAPLSAASKPSEGVAVRNSPRRKQPRPHSEIATGSCSGIGVGGSKPLEGRFPASIYETASFSPSSSPQHRQHPPCSQVSATASSSSVSYFQSSSSVTESGVYFHQQSAGIMAEMRVGGKGPRFESGQRSDGQEVNENSYGSGNTEVVLRYQNDSPFHVEDPEARKARQGLESLMCLDRSHIEDPALRQAPWYQAGIPREIALEILQQEEVGSFIVRDSTTHPGCFALSVRVPKFENSTGISHYLILNSPRGVRLKGLDKEWPNLTALVTHHTVMPEMLPCTLRLPRNNKNPTFRETEREDQEEDASYQRLTEVAAMTGQLKL